MNPIIHGEVSWLVSQRLSERRDRLLVTAAGLIPDVDGLSLLGGEDLYSKYHHVLTHGIVSAVVLSALLAVFARQRLLVAGLAFVAFHVHLLSDLAGSGPGWPLVYWWPFSRSEFGWSGQWDLASWQNSVIGLAVTLGVLWCAVPLGRTMVELVSVKADAKLVATIRKRLGRAS